MASGPITSWPKDGETMDSDRLIFLGSKITADIDCSHEIKRHLLLGTKTVTNLDRCKLKDVSFQCMTKFTTNKKNKNKKIKSRDISLPTKVHLVKGMVIPVVMYGCESWAIKKAEH